MAKNTNKKSNLDILLSPQSVSEQMPDQHENILVPIQNQDIYFCFKNISDCRQTEKFLGKLSADDLRGYWETLLKIARTGKDFQQSSGFEYKSMKGYEFATIRASKKYRIFVERFNQGSNILRLKQATSKNDKLYGKK